VLARLREEGAHRETIRHDDLRTMRRSRRPKRGLRADVRRIEMSNGDQDLVRLISRGCRRRPLALRSVGPLTGASSFDGYVALLRAALQQKSAIGLIAMADESCLAPRTSLLRSSAAAPT